MSPGPRPLDARTAGQRLPGLGHRMYREDPRTTALFAMAEQYGKAGQGVAFMRALESAVAETIKPLPINVDGAIAAVLHDLGYPARSRQADLHRRPHGGTGGPRDGGVRARAADARPDSCRLRRPGRHRFAGRGSAAVTSQPRPFYGPWIIAASFITFGLASGIAVLQHRVLLRLPARRPPLDAADGDARRARGDPADDLGGAAARAPFQSAVSHRRRHRPDVSRVSVVRPPARIVDRVLRGVVRVHDRLLLSGPIPHQIIISNWYRRKRGQAMGIAYIGGALAGAIGNKLAPVARVVHVLPQRDPGARPAAAPRVAAGAVRPEGPSGGPRPESRRRRGARRAGPRRRRVDDVCRS